MIYIILVYVVLAIMLVAGVSIEAKAETKREEIQDRIDRETLGKKYYEQLWGYGSWDNGR